MDNNFANESREELVQPVDDHNSFGNGVTPADQSVDYDSRDTAATNSLKNKGASSQFNYNGTNSDTVPTSD